MTKAPKRSLADDLLPLTPAWGMEYLPRVVAGDPDAVRCLIFVAQNNQRGKIVAALWKHRVAPEVLRVALADGYDHDHSHVCNAFRRRSLVAAFRWAKFPTDHLADEFTIWRGGSGDLAYLLSGFSWTRDRDIACWFAMRFAGIHPPPRLYRATVKREQVLAHLTGREEDEILIEPFSVSVVKTDGDVAAWKKAAHRHCQRVAKYIDALNDRSGSDIQIAEAAQ